MKLNTLNPYALGPRLVHNALLAAALVLGMWMFHSARALAQAPAQADDFKSEFNVTPADLASTGQNDYFILMPGYVQVFKSATKDKDHALTITVLNQTKKVAGIETRVVEEREEVGGKLEEVSRNYFAISKSTNDVYYFGELTKEYKMGRASLGSDSWTAGVKDARFGLAMPADPSVGMKYYEEQAPKVAMDRASVANLDVPFKAGDVSFDHCLQIDESSALEPDEKETKYYVKGIGQVMDEDMVLVSHDFKKLDPKASASPNKKSGMKQGMSDVGNGPIPKDVAREALAYVGTDNTANKVWFQAINDPARPANERQDLIEDLNETGFPDPKNLTDADLPLIQKRMAIIERIGGGAMDQTNAAAFQEAYKDLVNMQAKVLGQ